MPARYDMLRAALASVRNQEPAQDIEIVVALEDGAKYTPLSEVDIFVTGTSQVTKVNAGVAAASHDVIAFLHDDDLWHGRFLQHALQVLADSDFVSSTSLEVDEAGR
ncbi:MAG: hypothetical protein J2P48_08225, partial [Alphaproteobacteria bacterium]|nr:hypothetical protein [Alphaproteobacteria bacterium]